MAEAHQGVAFSFAVTEDEGLHLSVSLEAFKAILNSGVRSWRKILARFINQILNGVYPSHPLRGLGIIAVVIGLKRYKNFDSSFGIIPRIQESIPRNWITRDNAELTACTIFAGGVWLSIVAIRKYSLQGLFSYHGWMYDERGRISLKTKAWSVGNFFLKF
jgi:carnitine O-palmitoyltransferase 1